MLAPSKTSSRAAHSLVSGCSKFRTSSHDDVRPTILYNKYCPLIFPLMDRISNLSRPPTHLLNTRSTVLAVVQSLTFPNTDELPISQSMQVLQGIGRAATFFCLLTTIIGCACGLPTNASAIKGLALLNSRTNAAHPLYINGLLLKTSQTLAIVVPVQITSAHLQVNIELPSLTIMIPALHESRSRSKFCFLRSPPPIPEQRKSS